MRQLCRGGERLARRDDAINETDTLRLLAQDAAARQDQIHRAAVANEARQPDRAEIEQRHAEAAAINAENRIARGDPEIAPQGQFEAAGNRGTLDRSDNRL